MLTAQRALKSNIHAEVIQLLKGSNDTRDKGIQLLWQLIRSGVQLFPVCFPNIRDNSLKANHKNTF